MMRNRKQKLKNARPKYLYLRLSRYWLLGDNHHRKRVHAETDMSRNTVVNVFGTDHWVFVRSLHMNTWCSSLKDSSDQPTFCLSVPLSHFGSSVVLPSFTCKCPVDEGTPVRGHLWGDTCDFDICVGTPDDWIPVSGHLFSGILSVGLGCLVIWGFTGLHAVIKKKVIGTHRCVFVDLYSRIMV